MKIRNGFVSNSSSSSFILRIDKSSKEKMEEDSTHISFVLKEYLNDDYTGNVFHLCTTENNEDIIVAEIDNNESENLIYDCGYYNIKYCCADYGLTADDIWSVSDGNLEK